MFKALQPPGFPMRVYDLVYEGGADHKRYLTFLAREKEVGHIRWGPRLRVEMCVCVCVWGGGVVGRWG
jgi:hypothetical protein